MKMKYLKRIFISFLLLAVIGLGVIMWVNGQLKRAHGAYTGLVNTKNLLEPTPHLIIKNVNILSQDSKEFIANQNVTLKDGIITSIHKDRVDSNSNIKIVDGTNKYLIPGLVDSHVHLKESKNDLLLYLANGVTHIREMSGSTEHLKWKRSIEQGELGPRIYVASEKVNSKSGISGIFNSWTRRRINYASEEDAIKKIQWLHKEGFEAVKIGSFVNSEMHNYTVREAKKYDIPVIGHIPYSIGLDSIYKSGQCEFAHIEEITKQLIRQFGRITTDNKDEFIQYILENCDAVSSRLRENNIAVSTTVWLMESFIGQKFNLDTYIKEVELEYANPGLIEGTKLGRGWLPGNNSYAEVDEIMNDEKLLANSKSFWTTYIQAIHIMLKSLVKNDVLIMAGTDANVPIAIPGFSLHDELESLSKVGMTNSQVLYSATVAPGIWMKTKTGIIKEGYCADLVLLSNNPLENIKNTKSIEIVFSGKYQIKKKDIDQILQEVVHKNNDSRSIDITSYIN